MRNLLLPIIALSSLSACTITKEKSKNIESIGGTKDQHGCLVAAGQSWSKIKNNCIQIFNEGLRLNPIETRNNDAIISSFVIVSDDLKKAELFTPDNNESIILLSDDQIQYINGKYYYNAKDGILSIDGIKKYRLEK